eukprot:CAMPEP_0194183010 /NCGR_PEP_ID=MMETSP0154-20130528/28797_1 /TAXON_ID=1049557 /ORGANISM="Thalassiothrix antarctica, Strain L6-D1" /LENGTH=152 /DNA_ID=CAMNT_0038899669 /DNA_START=23 /DNA_END=482 /DNA_ORIENTATION=-
MSAKRKNNDELAEQDKQKKQQRISGKSKNEESSVESEEEEQPECEECGNWLDPEEAEECDGWCYRCHGSIKVNRIRAMIPSNFEIREVSGNHRKPCSNCGKRYWLKGDWYVCDAIQPWGTDKYCLDCAEHKNWGGSFDSADESDDQMNDDYY